MKSVIKYTLVLAGLCLAVFALRHHVAGVPALLGTVDYKFLVAAFIGLLAYQCWNASVWSEVLGAMGHQCGRVASMRIWLESESLKWLPGSVWSYGSRVVTAKRLGLNKKQASSSIILELMMTNVAWALLAVTIVFAQPVVQLALPWIDKAVVLGQEKWWLALLIAVALLGLAGLAFKFVWGNERFQQIFEIGKIDWLKCALTTAHYLLLCIWNASLLWLVFLAIPSIDIPLFTTLGVAGVAWMIGFWSIGIPGGIGVREAVIVLILSQYGTTDSGILAAVLWRALQMSAEISALLISLAIGARTHFKKGGEAEC